MSTSARHVRRLGARHLAIACLLAAGATRSHASSIVVHDTGAPSVSTCTLAQAINAANAASNVNASGYGSNSGSGNCSAAADFSFDITFDAALPPTIVLDGIDNYWYGRNALPPIATDIHIIGADAGTTLQAVHTGDPTPDAAHAFRFFYVSGGLDGQIHDNAAQPVAGTLTLENIVLQGGYTKGGNSRFGGGGAGMGGAIFNQGTLKLFDVALIGNVAQGGGYDPLGPATLYAGGGMGQDAQSGGVGGGFGGSLGGTYGSPGGDGTGVSGRGGSGGGRHSYQFRAFHIALVEQQQQRCVERVDERCVALSSDDKRREEWSALPRTDGGTGPADRLGGIDARWFQQPVHGAAEPEQVWPVHRRRHRDRG